MPILAETTGKMRREEERFLMS